MLRTRLWMGALLAAVALGLVVVDHWLRPGVPFLFLVLQGGMLLAGRELVALLPPNARPRPWVIYPSLFLLILANWPAHLLTGEWPSDPWHWVLGTFTLVVLSTLLAEMATFHTPGTAVPRIALTLLVAVYLGLLPSFFAQLRWLEVPRGGWALTLAVFVPKMGDTAAYLTGRFLGRHRMTPVLSPKKTWEGLAGGLLGAVLTAVLLNRVAPELTALVFQEGPEPPLLRGGDLAAAAFGLVVGGAGVLGDLAESLIKRDGQQKDASQSVPGFGGILDVIDSLLFAAPVAYAWLVIQKQLL